VKNTDLNETVDESVKFLSERSRVGRRDFSSGSPLRGDHIQLQQVILNLVVNAMDVMSNMAKGRRRIVIRTARSENWAEVSVADAGPGIPMDKLNDVFEPFFSTKSHAMGMGLSIARTIIESHNGQIWAESQGGDGAEFRIRLPLTMLPH
jgi:signal transduction histidine kinase